MHLEVLKVSIVFLLVLGTVLNCYFNEFQTCRKYYNFVSGTLLSICDKYLNLSAIILNIFRLR